MWSDNVACVGRSWSGMVIWLTNEKSVIKADMDLFILVPHATCAGLCDYCCNALMHSDQRSPNSRKFRRGGSFNSSTDWGINGSDIVAVVVISLPWLVLFLIAACEAGGTLFTAVMSGCLLPSVKVPPSETATMVCGNTVVVDGCFW